MAKTVGLAYSAKRSIQAAISLVWYAAHRSYEVFGLARKNRAKLIILYFHAVRANDVPAFRRQLEAIKTYADVVDADYVGKPDGRPKVAITFDDAFMSMVDNALPELIAHEMPYTIFVPTGCLGASPPWQMESTGLDRHEIVASGDTLRALVSMGARMGAHSRFHPKLTLLGPNEAQAEIRGSKADLECLLGRTVELFAFPYGDFNQQTLLFCKEAGYRFVYSIGPGSVAPTDTTMLRPRVAVELSDTRIEFWLKLRGGYEWMPFASAFKHKFLRARS
ncbi:MAG: polysaccharide deacetylase family protein [Methylocella sp.]